MKKLILILLLIFGMGGAAKAEWIAAPLPVTAYVTIDRVNFSRGINFSEGTYYCKMAFWFTNHNLYKLYRLSCLFQLYDKRGFMEGEFVLDERFNPYPLEGKTWVRIERRREGRCMGKGIVKHKILLLDYGKTVMKYFPERKKYYWLNPDKKSK